MNQFKNNIEESFVNVKRDVLTLYQHVQFLQAEIERLKTTKKVVVAKKVTRKAVPRSKFVASKGSTTFHTQKCAFAKNIKPKNKKVFASKATALNNGFKRCACVA